MVEYDSYGEERDIFCLISFPSWGRATVLMAITPKSVKLQELYAAATFVHEITHSPLYMYMSCAQCYRPRVYMVRLVSEYVG